MPPPIFRGIDHIMLRLPALEPLYTLFSDTFGLPVSWPLQRSGFAEFAWVTVGNTNLEFWAAADNSDLPENCQPPLIHGFALDPEDLGSSIEQLAARDIRCKAPRPYRTEDGQGGQVINFTNSVVLDVSSESLCVFFCAWNRDGNIYPWRERLDAVERKAREQGQLSACGGGALGIVGLAKISMMVRDAEEMRRRWQAISGSAVAPVDLGDGIALDLQPGQRDQIEGLSFCVKSLAQAKRFLEARGLLGSNAGGRLGISRQATGGLCFELIEAPAS